MKTKRIFNQILKPYKSIIKEITGNYTDIRITTGQTFCCYCRPEYDKEIEIPVFEDTFGNDTFNTKMHNKLQKVGVTKKYSNEILSFLHEIGHIYTWTKKNDTFYEFASTLLSKLNSLFKNCPKIRNWLYNRYYNLALERNADKWAINYIKNHQEQVNRWEIELAKNYKKTIPKLAEKLDLIV